MLKPLGSVLLCKIPRFLIRRVESAYMRALPRNVSQAAKNLSKIKVKVFSYKTKERDAEWAPSRS